MSPRSRVSLSWLLMGLASLLFLAPPLADGAVSQLPSINRRIGELQTKRATIIAKREVVIRELRSGLFCSECKRSKSQIEAGGEAFGVHLKNVRGKAIPMTEEELRKVWEEFSRDIFDIDREIASLQNEARQTAYRENQERMDEWRRERDSQTQKLRADQEASRQRFRDSLEAQRLEQQELQRQWQEANDNIQQFARDISERVAAEKAQIISYYQNRRDEAAQTFQRNAEQFGGDFEAALARARQVGTGEGKGGGGGGSSLMDRASSLAQKGLDGLRDVANQFKNTIASGRDTVSSKISQLGDRFSDWTSTTVSNWVPGGMAGDYERQMGNSGPPVQISETGIRTDEALLLGQMSYGIWQTQARTVLSPWNMPGAIMDGQKIMSDAMIGYFDRNVMGGVDAILSGRDTLPPALTISQAAGQFADSVAPTLPNFALDVGGYAMDRWIAQSPPSGSSWTTSGYGASAGGVSSLETRVASNLPESLPLSRVEGTLARVSDDLPPAITAPERLLPGSGSPFRNPDETVSFLIPESVYRERVLEPMMRNELPTIGRENVWVTPKSVMNDVLAESHGNLDFVKSRLGIEDAKWREPLYRVDVPNPAQFNPRLPTALDAGANSKWVPGGYTSGGIPEAVMDPVPFGKYRVTPTGVAPLALPPPPAAGLPVSTVRGAASPPSLATTALSLPAQTLATAPPANLASQTLRNATGLEGAATIANSPRLGMFFMDEAIAAKVQAPGATLGRPGQPHFFMALEDGLKIRNVNAAARETGMAPSVERVLRARDAWEQNPVGPAPKLYAVVFPTDGLPVTFPTLKDAMGADGKPFPHFVGNNRTGVQTAGEYPGLLLNNTFEFIVPGGGAMPPMSFLIELTESGELRVVRKLSPPPDH